MAKKSASAASTLPDRLQGVANTLVQQSASNGHKVSEDDIQIALADIDVDDEELRTHSVERRDHGPRIQEHYRVDEAGLVRVTITDLTDGYSRRYVLGRRTL